MKLLDATLPYYDNMIINPNSRTTEYVGLFSYKETYFVVIHNVLPPLLDVCFRISERENRDGVKVIIRHLCNSTFLFNLILITII